MRVLDGEVGISPRDWFESDGHLAPNGHMQVRALAFPANAKGGRMSQPLTTDGLTASNRFISPKLAAVKMEPMGTWVRRVDLMQAVEPDLQGSSDHVAWRASMCRAGARPTGLTVAPTLSKVGSEAALRVRRQNHM